MNGSTRADTQPEAPAFDATGEAKLLLRSIRTAALATLLPADGGPFGTLVNVATGMDGAPLLLLSQLSAHTQNLQADARLSLLLAATGDGDPLSHPRLTLVGRAAPLIDEAARDEARRRFLARHPHSALYADFADFGFWRVEISRVHLNGGFARAANVTPDELLTDVSGAADLREGEAGALDHMNRDHADALSLYATVLAGKPAGAWRATGVDPEGIDLLSETASARLHFPAPVCDTAMLRRTLVALVQEARRLQANFSPAEQA